MGAMEPIILRALSSLERAQDPFEREDHGLPADALPVAGEAARLRAHRAVPRPGEPHRADALRGGPARAPRPPGDGHRNRSLAALELAACNLARRLLAYRAVRAQRLGAHAEELLFRLVGIGDEAPVEPGRRARRRGHDLRYP